MLKLQALNPQSLRGDLTVEANADRVDSIGRLSRLVAKCVDRPSLCGVPQRHNLKHLA